MKYKFFNFIKLGFFCFSVISIYCNSCLFVSFWFLKIESHCITRWPGTPDTDSTGFKFVIFLPLS